MNQMNDEHINQEPLPADELVQCKAKADEYLNGWQRAKADFINYKNDEARRLEDMARYISRSLMEDILPVLDSFDLALKSNGKAEKEIVNQHQDNGILLIRSQLLDMLKKRGLELMHVSAGDHFDPAKHEALEEVETELPSGSIVEEIQKGYTLQGRVLRPARVRVAK